MWKKVTVDPKFGKKGKVPSTVIKKIAMQIKYKLKQKYGKDYNETIDYGGSRYFVVYQFHADDVLFIKQARIVKR